MSAKAVWGWTALLVLPMLIGGRAAADDVVVRGQSPAGAHPMAYSQAYAVQPAGHHRSPIMAHLPARAMTQGYGRMQPVAMHDALNHSGGMHWSGGYSHHPNWYGNPYCEPGGWGPTHYHTFEYRQPKNLLYPPANQPAAVVQYPYYTVRGPTDFFLK